MSDGRCHSCNAAVPPEAQWCSLCFADLRTPAVVREPVTVPATPESSVVAPAAPVAPPTPVAPLTPAPVATAPAASAPAPTAEQVVAALPTPVDPHAQVDQSAAAAKVAKVAKVAKAEPRWPCPRCEASVPISLDECPECGAGFLSGAAQQMSTKLPVVGDVSRMSQGQRLLIAGGIAVVLMFVLVLLLEVGGHLLG